MSCSRTPAALYVFSVTADFPFPGLAGMTGDGPAVGGGGERGRPDGSGSRCRVPGWARGREVVPVLSVKRGRPNRDVHIPTPDHVLDCLMRPPAPAYPASPRACRGSAAGTSVARRRSLAQAGFPALPLTVETTQHRSMPAAGPGVDEEQQHVAVHAVDARLSAVWGPGSELLALACRGRRDRCRNLLPGFP